MCHVDRIKIKLFCRRRVASLITKAFTTVCVACSVHRKTHLADASSVFVARRGIA